MKPHHLRACATPDNGPAEQNKDAIEQPVRSPAATPSTPPSPGPTSSLPQKRPLARQFSSRTPGSAASTPKRVRLSSGTSPSLIADDARRGRQGSIGDSPRLHLRDRASSPAQTTLLEAAATMLSRAEETHRHTVRLARAAPGSPIPARPSPLPPSRHASDENVLSRTRAESHTKKSPDTQLLQSIALAKFLQQDDRPVFIVNLDDQSHHNGETLGILFANNTLRSHAALFEHVQRESSTSEHAEGSGPPFEDFRAWVLSSANDDETVLPFPFYGVLWKSSLRSSKLLPVTRDLCRLQNMKHHPRAPCDNQCRMVLLPDLICMQGGCLLLLVTLMSSPGITIATCLFQAVTATPILPVHLL